MAKSNNLTDFLTDVADAIREKKGTTDPINPQDFSAEIASISSGAEAKPLNDVNFFDYDGTILHSFTAAEFLALSAMPALPTQEGLICQEWNWTYEAAREYVEEFGLCDIGATYITDDGKTRIYIHIEEEGRRNAIFQLTQSTSNGVVIDWGDGSATETYASTSFAATHEYANGGDYCVSLSPKSTYTLNFGTSLYGIGGNKGYAQSMITRIHIGQNMTALKGLSKCSKLETISIPTNVATIYSSAFSSCCSLQHIVIPSSITNIDKNIFNGCTLKYISLPHSISSIGEYAFDGCYRLSRCVLPNAVSVIGRYAFQNTYSLKNMYFPKSVSQIRENAFRGSGISTILVSEGLTRIWNNCFYNCHSLLYVKFPSSISMINDSAFSYADSVLYYDFRDVSSVPTGGSYVLDGHASDCKVIVADSMYLSWIEDTNWSVYAEIIVKASEYNG